MSADADLQKINEEIYKRNLELAVLNKNLSLLRKLYQISILTLEPKVLSERITDEIRLDLNMEAVGIFVFDQKTDILSPLNFSKSERLTDILEKSGFDLKDISIPEISKHTFFQSSIYGKISNSTENLSDVWGGFINEENLKKLKEESHWKTTLLYPLVTESNTIGALLIGLNREYQTLNDHEKESIKSLIDVVAVALDKAYLYKELQDANESLRNLLRQRESLVHLVTHKVKGSFTRSKYIFAEMLEGTFGEISPVLKGMAEKGLDSDNQGIETVDLVLNAANLQTGTVKYEMKLIDFKEIVDHVIVDMKKPIESKGLKLEINISEGKYNTSGDSFWLKEVVHNLVDNSLKYTKEGSIKVNLENKDGKILLGVKDTGVGITDEDKQNLFKEGGRGQNSVKVNVDSTGYGLFSVKLIVDAHKGRVWAESDGQGKGSSFFVELPIA
jgi:signal transduction histidine kinase